MKVRLILCLLLGLWGFDFAWAAEDDGRTISRGLAELALKLKADDISPAAYEAAKRAVLDVIGVTLAGHDSAGIAAIVEQMRDWGGKPEATVWVYGGKLPAPEATFVNSTIAHALDLDDLHVPSMVHVTSVIVPAAFAVAEARGASGRETLAAVVLGAEVAARLGPAYLQRVQHEGFLPTSVLGGFGAAAAACRLQGCSVDQTVDALGIFFAHASGSRQALYDRTMTKRVQPAIAARAGVFAGYLAARGLTGPEHALEGEAGLYRIYGNDKVPPPTAAEILAPHDFWEIERVSFKRYSSCGASHAVIQAAIDLANQHDLKLADIAEIELFGVGVNSGMVGVPWAPHRTPHILVQFCAPYEVVAAIKNRRMGPAEIAPERVQSDQEVSDLAARVQLKNPEQFGGQYPGGQTIRIRTKQGRILVASRVLADALHPDLFRQSDVIRKFQQNAEFSGICSAQQAEAIVAAVQRLDQAGNLGRFVQQHLVLKGAAKKR
jgi:2-methylcitrate dehydratase PrpD